MQSNYNSISTAHPMRSFAFTKAAFGRGDLGDRKLCRVAGRRRDTERLAALLLILDCLQRRRLEPGKSETEQLAQRRGCQRAMLIMPSGSANQISGLSPPPFRLSVRK